MGSSPQSIEPVVYEVVDTSTLSPNSAITSSPINVGRRRKQSVTLSRKRNVVFFALFLCFVTSFVSFFFIIASTYPLKPELYIEQFYVRAIDRRTPNIGTKDNDLAFFGLRFENRNRLISVSYDSFINVTIHYYPNSTTTTTYFANATLEGFNQSKGKPFTITDQKVVPPPGMSAGLLKMRKDSTTVAFRVDVWFSIRFHCRELGKHKHQFQMTAKFVVSLENGSSFENTIKMDEE